MAKYGIVIVSHVEAIASGIATLLSEVSKDLPITYAGGTDDGDVGSSFDKVMRAFEENEAEELLCFYDLGSAKMTLEMVMELSDKKAYLFDTALIESAFTATALLSAQLPLEEVQKQLLDLKIK